MSWKPPRDSTDPVRFYSGDAIRDYLCTCSASERNALLLTIDIEQLRPYVITACLQITRGEPRGFYTRARERLTKIWGTQEKADELIMMAMAHAESSKRVWMERRNLG